MLLEVIGDVAEIALAVLPFLISQLLLEFDSIVDILLLLVHGEDVADTRVLVILEEELRQELTCPEHILAGNGILEEFDLFLGIILVDDLAQLGIILVFLQQLVVVLDILTELVVLSLALQSVFEVSEEPELFLYLIVDRQSL